MLQRIRDSLQGQKWLAYLLLGALALVFAAWGAYGIVNLNFGGANYAAEANGSKISLEDARNVWLRQQSMWQQRLGGGELPQPLRTRLQDQVLESLIRRALITERSHDLGYRVSNQALLEAVQAEPAFQVDGKYDPQAAKAALAQAGVSLDTYTQQLRTDLQQLQLEGGIRASDFVTSSELTRLTDLEDQQREVRYLVLPADRFRASAAIDDAAVQAYYKEHLAQYMRPESADVQYGELRLEALAAQQQVSDADLHAAYEKEKSRLEVPEKRHARHILITGKDDAAALALAQQVLSQAKSGKDFGELAKQYSQDPGSAQNGGDLGWAERSTFVKPFADALYGMSVGEIAGPVKTQYGYHIIRLEEIQHGKSKSFEEARPELEAQLRRARATDRFGEIQEQLQAKLAEPNADLNALAQQYNLQQGEVKEFVKGAGGVPFGAAPQLQELLFGDPPLAADKLGGPALLGDDRLVIFKVLEHRAPAPKPLAEVRDSIVAAISKEQGTRAALGAAQGARAELLKGASFDRVALELKVSADPAHFIGRNDPSVPAQVREAAFALAKPAGKPEYEALALNDGGAALLAVSAVRTAPTHEAEAQSGRVQQESERLGTAAALAYVEEVRRTASVRKNPKAFD
ncbi:MAG TPA: SurA N-terminal domain-containing protein [Steroidobacteraceae bacterium]|jgi:peptidyl-prolyl cis-trans isomerase D|nr:SurA N-terminal domain-containing protein [Steroidobacteraceae bacterium]